MRRQASERQLWRPMGYDPQVLMEPMQMLMDVVLNHETCRKKCMVAALTLCRSTGPLPIYIRQPTPGGSVWTSRASRAREVDHLLILVVSTSNYQPVREEAHQPSVSCVL